MERVYNGYLKPMAGSTVILSYSHYGFDKLGSQVTLWHCVEGMYSCDLSLLRT